MVTDHQFTWTEKSTCEFWLEQYFTRWASKPLWSQLNLSDCSARGCLYALLPKRGFVPLQIFCSWLCSSLNHQFVFKSVLPVEQHCRDPTSSIGICREFYHFLYFYLLYFFILPCLHDSLFRCVLILVTLQVFGELQSSAFAASWCAWLLFHIKAAVQEESASLFQWPTSSNCEYKTTGVRKQSLWEVHLHSKRKF